MNSPGLHTSARRADNACVVRLALTLVATSSLAACASTGAVYTPRPFPVPGGGSAPVAIPASPGASGTSPAPVDPAAPATASPDPAVPPSVAARPAPARPPLSAPGRGTADGYALSGTALSLRGAPYRSGGGDPNGFDCSGFVRYVYQQHGVAMPRETREQFRVGKNVDRSDLEPGDLVFFSTTAPGASHVGIVVGGDQFVHAPSERGVVRVENLSAQYWASRYVGAKRVN
ncbi:MAG TPA: C40 family peptidase [Vicinamibacterales bacterium]|nr:C40 family peptidase [Vicinamibacterales bacterium]